MSRLSYTRYRRRFANPLRTAAGVFTEREGILIKIKNHVGEETFGEIAPWPGFGCETLDEAETFLKEFRNTKTTPVPPTLPCTRAAFSMTRQKISPPALRFAALLPAGSNAPAMLAAKRKKGFSTFKLKITGNDFPVVSEILIQLRAGEKLRIDANGTLDDLAPWLPLLENPALEFLEQPFSPARMAREKFPPATEAKLALDESISAAQMLPENWRGFLIIKPALLGDWDEFCRQRAKVSAPEKIIYSSVFETEIGRAAALSLAGEDPFAADNAHGFDTLDFFEDDNVAQTFLSAGSGDIPVARKFAGGARMPREPADKNVCATLAELLDALEHRRSFFCINPHWGETERAEADAIISTFRGQECPRPKIFIPTGGTGGKVKFIPHTPATLEAAARAQCEILAGGKPVFSLSPLPSWHISGIMPVFRTRVSDGRIQVCDGKFSPDVSLLELPADAEKFFNLVSLVPTQLRRIFERSDSAGAAWLRQFDCVLLGGAATPADLLERCRREKIRVAIGYGMTETAAFIALHTPENFLANKPVSGKILSHARINILDTNGNPVPENTPGRIEIFAESIPLPENKFLTQDEGFLDTAGELHLLGRIDRFINTGGEKIDPRRVENVLLGSPEITGALVVGEPDAQWGERVVALIETKKNAGIAGEKLFENLAELVRMRLVRHCVPKRFICVKRLPFNEKGKIDRATLEKILISDA